MLARRLRNRSQAEQLTSETVIESRLAEAKNELKKIWDYKYALVNDVLDQAAAEMRAIVLSERGEDEEVRSLAASCRTDAASPRLKAVLRTFES